MNASQESRRRRRGVFLGPEPLEGRIVMSSGEGSTFAIMPGTVATAGQVSSLSFKIDPTLFTAPKKDHGKITIGIDIAPATPSTSSSTTTSTLKPEIVSVTDPNGHVVRVQHATYDPKVAKENHLGQTTTSAVIVPVQVPAKGQPAGVYSVQVKGLQSTTGTYLVGFYLPGDVDGTGTVTKADITTIKSYVGMTAENSKYNFDADVNRNGVIDSTDVALAKKDLGASTLVSPVVSVNLDPASDPAMNNTTPYSIVHFAGQVTPNATVTFLNTTSNSSTVVTANSTGAYSILVPLVPGSNSFSVTTLDAFGQSITGTITPVAYDPSSPNPTASTST
jgi:Dockerin type I domain